MARLFQIIDSTHLRQTSIIQAQGKAGKRPVELSTVPSTDLGGVWDIPWFYDSSQSGPRIIFSSWNQLEDFADSLSKYIANIQQLTF